MKRSFLIGALALIITGCVSTATKDHVATQVAAHDGACRLIEQTIGGTLPANQAQNNITQDQLDRTPASVKRLLANVIRFVYDSRLSYYTLNYTLGNGQDPASLALSDPPAAISSLR